MMHTKTLVVDANILIRAVLGQKVQYLIANHYQHVTFLTPEVCFIDAQKYLPLLFAKRHIPIEPAMDILNTIEKMVQIVDHAIYKLHEESAKSRIKTRDLDDWPVVATALAWKCPIWTEDMDFFGSGIPTWTTDRIILFLTDE